MRWLVDGGKEQDERRICVDGRAEKQRYVLASTRRVGVPEVIFCLSPSDLEAMVSTPVAAAWRAVGICAGRYRR